MQPAYDRTYSYAGCSAYERMQPAYDRMHRMQAAYYDRMQGAYDRMQAA